MNRPADTAETDLMQAIEAYRLRRYEEALSSCARAIALQPDFAAAYLWRGTIQFKLGLASAAVASYDTAIAMAPQLADAQVSLWRGRALRDMGRLEDALASYDRAAELQSDDAEIHGSRAIVLQELNRLDAALASYDRAVALAPRSAKAHSNRGTLLQALNNLDAAVGSYDRAIALDANFAMAHFNKARALLLRGDFAAGWPGLEWRFRTPHGRTPAGVSGRAWDGAEPLAGKTILLYSEWGLGDVIQFCRYSSLVADLGATVLLEVPEQLYDLAARLDGVSERVLLGAQPPRTDFHCSLLSLPLAFRTSLSNIPARVPYLHADSMRVERWRQKLGEARKPRVGIVWSGGYRPNHALNNRRNIPLTELAPLQDTDIEFYTLQKGQPAEGELAALRTQGWNGPELIDFTTELRSFADTAALIECLDLVVSVDTSVAHLAGALDKPVWILNRFDSCWRWLLDRPDTPWYPSARLYRQKAPGDWQPVVYEIKAALSSWMQATGNNPASLAGSSIIDSR